MDRRSLLIGLGAALVAPAIVRASSLMPIRAIPLKVYGYSPAMARGLPDIHTLNRLRLALVDSIMNPPFLLNADGTMMTRMSTAQDEAMLRDLSSLSA